MKPLVTYFCLFILSIQSSLTGLVNGTPVSVGQDPGLRTEVFSDETPDGQAIFSPKDETVVLSHPGQITPSGPTPMPTTRPNPLVFSPAPQPLINTLGSQSIPSLSSSGHVQSSSTPLPYQMEVIGQTLGDYQGPPAANRSVDGNLSSIVRESDGSTVNSIRNPSLEEQAKPTEQVAYNYDLPVSGEYTQPGDDQPEKKWLNFTVNDFAVEGGEDIIGLFHTIATEASVEDKVNHVVQLITRLKDKPQLALETVGIRIDELMGMLSNFEHHIQEVEMNYDKEANRMDIVLIQRVNQTQSQTEQLDDVDSFPIPTTTSTSNLISSTYISSTPFPVPPNALFQPSSLTEAQPLNSEGRPLAETATSVLPLEVAPLAETSTVGQPLELAPKGSNGPKQHPHVSISIKQPEHSIYI